MCWMLGLLSLLPLFAPLMAPPPVAPAVRMLEARTAAYYEDAAVPRPVARVEVELVATRENGENDETVLLRVAVAALGGEVDALPGLEGVPGANLRTAEELERLLREGALRLVTRVAGTSLPGECKDIRWQRLPCRRLAKGLQVDFAAETALWPVRVLFASAPLPQGSVWCYLEADGVPRLAVHVHGERIVAIESLGAREVLR